MADHPVPFVRPAATGTILGAHSLSRPWWVGLLGIAAAAGVLVLIRLASAALAQWAGPAPVFFAQPRREATRTPGPARPVRPAPAEPAAHMPASVEGPAAWQVQVGAFRRAEAAKAYWRNLARALPEFDRARPQFVEAQGVTRVRAGSWPTEAAAREGCRHLQSAGYPCFVTRAAPDVTGT
jgi:cell division septation protein DedD